MDVFELVAKLRLDSSEYEAGLKNAKNSGDKFGKASKGLQALDRGVTKVLKIGAAAATAAAAGMTVFAKSAVDTGMGFDAAMSQVAATLGTTVDQIGDLREKAQEMGATTVYSAKEAAEGLNILAMSGYNAEQSISMIEDVLHLAAAGSMDMASAAGYVSGAMKGFADDSKDAGYYADLMAKGATLANTSVSQLGDALSSGAAVAASYGQTAETTTIALLRLAEQGEAGSAAGTALAAAMKNLYAPTDQAAKKLEELNVKAFDPVTKEARDFNTVVNELQAAMAGMTAEERTANAQLIFGIQGFNAYNKMVVTGTERQAEWADALAHASDAGGEAARQYATMTDNLQGDLTSLSSATEGVKIAFSEGVTPAIRETVQQLTKMLQKKSTQEFMRNLGQQAGNLAKTLTGKLGNALPRIMTLFEDGGKKIKIAGAAFATFVIAVKAAVNPIGAIASALGVLGASMAASALTADEAKKKMSGLTDEQYNNVEATLESIDAYNELKKSREATYSSIDTEADKTRDLWNTLQSLVDEKGRVIDGNEDQAASIAGQLSEALGVEIEIVDGVIQKYDELSGSIEGAIQKRRAMSKLSAAEEGYNKAKDGLKGVAETIYDLNGEVDTASQKVRELQDSYDEWANADQSDATVAATAQAQMAALSESLEQAKGVLAERQNELETAKAQEAQYYQDINDYERAFKESSEGNWDAVNQILDKNSNERLKHLLNSSNVSKQELAQFTRNADILIAETERYAQKLNEGAEGYSEDGLKALQDQTLEAVEMLAEANEKYADKGSEGGEKYADELGSKSGEASSAASDVTSAAGKVLDQFISKAGKYGGEAGKAWSREFEANAHATTPTASSGGSGGDGEPGKAIGLDYVPYNKYPTVLHRGEAVLTAREADAWRRGGSAGGNDPNVGAILEVLQEIAQNGLNANISRNQVYRVVNDENRKRSRATNYNSLAMA